ncbi:MAG: type III-B CRISPR module RAMP protein Cmr6 [Thermoproteus sp.]
MAVRRPPPWERGSRPPGGQAPTRTRGPPPRREEAREEGGPRRVDCVASGYNITSCVIRTIIERYQADPSLEFPQLSREIALSLKDYKLDLNSVKSYLAYLEKALGSTYPALFRVDVEIATPLVVHVRNPYMPLEIGLAWHPILNVPYIPATSIRGVLRAHGREICGVQARQLFGDVGLQGALVVTDALPTSELALGADVITPHYKEPDFRETKAGPIPLVFPVVRPGATFAFFVASDALSNNCKADLYSFIRDALAEGIGAKTRVGYGTVKVK